MKDLNSTQVTKPIFMESKLEKIVRCYLSVICRLTTLEPANCSAKIRIRPSTSIYRRTSRGVLYLKHLLKVFCSKEDHNIFHHTRFAVEEDFQRVSSI